VKSISMASFKPEEIKGLLEGGNAIARQTWMARWSPSDFPEPDPGDPERLRQFIRLKYIDKKWVAGGSSGTPPTQKAKNVQKPTKGDNNIPKPEPLTNILGNDIPPMHVGQQSPLPSDGWATFPSVKATTPIPPAVKVAPITPSLWETPQTNNNNSGLEGLLFPSQEQVQKIEAEKLAKAQEEQAKKKKSTDLLANLGTMYQQQAATNQQSILLQQQQMVIQMCQGLPPQQQQMFIQMAQGGLNPQQLQILLQQIQMMKQLSTPGIIPGVTPINQFGVQTMPGNVPNTFGTQSFEIQNPGGMQQGRFVGGFNLSTSPTGLSGGITSLEPQKPVEPPKPDPFAALSPFSGGVKTSIPSKTTSPPKNSNDPFGMIPQNDTNAQRNQEINPFGISQTANTQSVPKQDDFNPFF